MSKRALFFICALTACVGLFAVSGCCSANKPLKTRKKASLASADSGKKSRRTHNKALSADLDVPCLIDIENEPNKITPLTNSQLQTKRLYERLESAYKMFVRKNYNGAMHEIENMRQNIHDDPLLEMKAWYLSALIYDKMGKPSRRKFSMNKLLKAFEAVQKDKRFLNARGLRLPMQQLADIARKAGAEKYEN